MNSVVLGDSLAKGIVHQMAREFSTHMAQQKVRLSLMAPMRSECRTTRYKHAIKVISGFLGSGLTRSYEVGEGKHKCWIAHAVMPNPSGALVRASYRVPFRAPPDFQSRDDCISAAPHCVQRMIQIHGMNDPVLIQALWITHSAALDRAIATSEPNEKGSYVTFGPSEMVIWRPSEVEEDGWVAVTAIGMDVLDGPNLKLYRRLNEGFKDKGVLSIEESDYSAYLSRSLRLRLAIGLLSDKPRNAINLAA
jgi:hypothetical protein